MSEGESHPLDTPLLPAEAMPRHIAIIMDGNNRWARQRHLPGAAGHRAGVQSVRDVIETCGRQQIPFLTLFAFSTENWQRPQAEVSALMGLFLNTLEKESRRMHENGVRLSIVGERSRFDQRLRQRMREAEELTAANDRLRLTICANYGGRWDIAQAARSLAAEVAAGTCAPESIDEAAVAARLTTAGLPDPDLCIRTGGEYRISNFLLWQLAYTEIYTTETYWPDFRQEQMAEAIREYGRRQRRFGKSGEQLGDEPGGQAC